MVPQTLKDWTLLSIEALLDANCIEDGRFDWKAMFPPDDKGKDRLVRSAAAMANAGGGFIVFGVADRGSGADRACGMAADAEMGARLASQLKRADPPIPHRLSNPPIPVAGGRVIYVLEVRPDLAPHADSEGRYFERSGGGTDQPISTHGLRRRMAADTEVPGLNEIKKQAFAFLRPRGWDRVRAGLESIAAYAAEGTPRQKVAVLESLTRLAIYTRQRMPRDVIAEMLLLCEEATPYRLDDTPDSEMFDSAVTLAADVAGHVGYDVVLHMPERDGFLVYDCARLLSQQLHLATKEGRQAPADAVLEQFEKCIDAAKRATPKPWTDAARWFEHKRSRPGRGRQRPPRRLDAVEARLLGVHEPPEMTVSSPLPPPPPPPQTSASRQRSIPKGSRRKRTES
jgi:hypothetical protein